MGTLQPSASDLPETKRLWKEKEITQTPQKACGHSGGTAWALGHSTPSDQSLPPLCILQVKQIMEEAVTRKFVHEDSSHIISFCGEWWPQWWPQKRRQRGAASWMGCSGGDVPGSQLLLHVELCDSEAILGSQRHSVGGSGFGNVESWEKG